MSLFKKIFGGDKTVDEAENSKPQVNSAPAEDIPETVSTETLSVFGVTASDSDNPFLNQILTQYEEGFKSLNKAGVDFFEFYQSVISSDVENADSYKMAFNMIKAMDPNFTKESAVKDANYYMTEIHNVFVHFKGKGEADKQAEITKKENERQTLSKEISVLEIKFNEIQTALSEKKKAFNSIDSRYDSKVADIDLKMKANAIARDTIIQKIRTVMTNLKKHL